MADDKLTRVAPAGAIAKRESFIPKGDMTGTENITADDVRLPRLAIAQGLSNQMIEGDSLYIPDLKLFEMFNDMTSDIYGKGPIQFIPVRRDVLFIEFDPENRGVPLDLNVPPNDPRTRWTKDENGRSVPPKATRYVEFVILMLRDPTVGPEPIMLSIKTTNKWQQRAADRLTGFIKFPQPPKPIYSGLYTVQSKPEKNDEGTFGVYVIHKVRSLDAPDQSDEEWAQSAALYRIAEGFYRSLEGKVITVNREVGADDVEFPTNGGNADDM